MVDHGRCGTFCNLGGLQVRCGGKLNHNGPCQFTYTVGTTGTTYEWTIPKTKHAGYLGVLDTGLMMCYEGGPVKLVDGKLMLHAEAVGPDQRNVWMAVLTGRHVGKWERAWAPVANRTQSKKLVVLTWEAATSLTMMGQVMPLTTHVHEILIEAKCHHQRGYILAEGNTDDGFTKARSVGFQRAVDFTNTLMTEGVAGYADAEVDVVPADSERMIDL